MRSPAVRPPSLPAWRRNSKVCLLAVMDCLAFTFTPHIQPEINGQAIATHPGNERPGRNKNSDESDESDDAHVYYANQVSIECQGLFNGNSILLSSIH